MKSTPVYEGNYGTFDVPESIAKTIRLRKNGSPDRRFKSLKELEAWGRQRDHDEMQKMVS